jgi:hypothetical protein
MTTFFVLFTKNARKKDTKRSGGSGYIKPLQSGPFTAKVYTKIAPR